jgi:hypothetical protein
MADGYRRQLRGFSYGAQSTATNLEAVLMQIVFTKLFRLSG